MMLWKRAFPLAHVREALLVFLIGDLLVSSLWAIVFHDPFHLLRSQSILLFWCVAPPLDGDCREPFASQFMPIMIVVHRSLGNIRSYVLTRVFRATGSGPERIRNSAFSSLSPLTTRLVSQAEVAAS